jgi:hypothetical protein
LTQNIHRLSSLNCLKLSDSTPKLSGSTHKQPEIQAFAGFHTNDKFYINYSLYKMASLLALMNRAVSYFTEPNNEMNSDDKAVEDHEEVETEKHLCSKCKWSGILILINFMLNVKCAIGAAGYQVMMITYGRIV